MSESAILTHLLSFAKLCFTAYFSPRFLWSVGGSMDAFDGAA